MGALIAYLEQLKQRFLALPLPHRLVAGALAGAGVLALVFLLLMSSPGEYGVLFAHLSQEDAAAIVAKLRNKKVPYRLEAGGTSILVPKQDVYELRLLLASEGIPKGGGVGFEIFDRQNLGVTDFVQRLNYQRALQGELARTLTGMPEIAEARVHIVTPKESLFLEDQQRASASVAVKLRPGRRLSPQQIDGIVHLVATAVPGLSPSQVTVVDLDGRILSKPPDALTPGGLSTAQMSFQRQVEEGYERKLQSLFDQLVGPQKSVIRVTAELDFQKIDIREETFTPNKDLVRSEQKNLERSTRGMEGGNPEARFELGQGTVTPPPPGKGPPPLTAPAPPKPPGSTVSERQSEVRNYELNRVLRQVVDQPGKIRRLSLAVVVDGTYPDKTKAFTPRPPEELRQFANLAKKAVGFDAERGDQLEITCAPLAAQVPEGVGASATAGGWQEGWWGSLKVGAILLLVLFALMVLLHRRRRTARPHLLELPQPASLPAPEAAGELPPGSTQPALRPAAPPPAQLPDAVEGQEKVAQLVAAYPERAVEVLRLWLQER
ncbi:MAG: flagellar M-ring protein FliF [Syntrophobacterales bacterium]|nr:flagellar M-ring protein FliF [Syntrophobacterales bacterium]